MTSFRGPVIGSGFLVGGLVVAGVGLAASWLLAVGVAGVGAIALGMWIPRVEGDRWRAQDVAMRYNEWRQRHWIEDAGGPAPLDGAAAEIWLGVHQPGSVPEHYRALAMRYAEPGARADAAAARLPEASPLERIQKAWIRLSVEWRTNGRVDLTEFETLAGSLPAADEPAMWLAWAAMVRSSIRWLDGRQDWLTPLADAWATCPIQPLTRRQVVKLWISRYMAVLEFLITAAVVSLIVFSVAAEWH